MATPCVVARLLLPDDANPSGNVHGGTTLKLMEEAGMIAATRHMSATPAGKGSLAALVRFETMAFHKPIYVGEVASCRCEILFTSKQSILVEVVVTAEDFSKAETRVTNTGWLWYVPMKPRDENDTQGEWVVVSVPQMAVPDEEGALRKYERAREHYEKRKLIEDDGQGVTADETKSSVDDDGFEAFKKQYTPPDDGRTPAESEQILAQIVLPGDCGRDKVAFAGFVMKLMDNAAGCSAWRHCRTNVVTVAISDMDFVSWVRLGDLCTIKSRAVFASAKSLEIEVVASVANTRGEEKNVARGLFTFVSIGKDGKVRTLPGMMLESEEDMKHYYLGQRRYEAAKRARSSGR